MSCRILIVEDETLVALEMQSILEENGYGIAGIAADLDSAMALASGALDLALVDLNLRDGLTGPQIAQRLVREHEVGVLFITANPRLLGDGIAGTIGVLSKPTDEASLIAAVEFAIKRRRGEDASTPPSLVCFG
jgi:two-component system, response regulator PdtaR